MRILCLGDSLTEGTVGVGYIPFLEELLPGNEYVNLGVNGDTIAGLRRRAERLQMRGDAVLIWIGTNDVLMSLDCSHSAVAADYSAILRLAAGRAAKVLVVPPLLADPALAREYQQSYSAVTELVRQAGKRAGAVYVDIQATFAGSPGKQFTIDGAHLNGAGARLVAEAFAGHVRAVAG